ncbi:MAG: TM2 domain-containing protein [Elainellaceae cyanobacterium]
MNSKGTSYILWLTIFLGLGGMHRFYNGKMVSGLIWLLTGGLFGVGQIIDLLLIPGMVEDHNLKYRTKHLLIYDPSQPAVTQPLESKGQMLESKEQPPTAAQLRMQLLRAAQQRGGRLSLTQAVIDTGVDFDQVEPVLLELVQKGRADLQNDARTGAVVYTFDDLV